MLDGKLIEEITEVDLQTLKDNAVQEKKTLEYKATLPGNSYDDKKEFLADVSSFANAAGGYLLYGVKASGGIPTDVSGIEGIVADDEILRLENLLRTCIEPRIPGVSIRPIELQSSAIVILLHIPRSWTAPHVVVFQGHWRFYSRNSAGKYPLDVTELRAAFRFSDTVTERITRFRNERIARIVAGETPVRLADGGRIVLQIAPISMADPTVQFDTASLAQHRGELPPLYCSGWNNRHNFDGFLTYSTSPHGAHYASYLQIFRNGSVEAVDARLLLLQSVDHNESLSIPSVAFEKGLIEALHSYLAVQRLLGVSPPVLVMLTLLGTSGYRMGVRQSSFWDVDPHPIDRDSLIIPEVMIETFDCEPTEVLRPIFDTVWNAAGWPRSINYDEHGTWRGH